MQGQSDKLSRTQELGDSSGQAGIEVYNRRVYNAFLIRFLYSQRLCCMTQAAKSFKDLIVWQKHTNSYLEAQCRIQVTGAVEANFEPAFGA